MSSGGKGGGANSTKNYYGTLAGVICGGPIDWLRAVIHNGRYLFQGPLMLTEDVTDLTGAIADPSYIARGGYLHIHRGTETQPADVNIPNQPRDKGTAKIVGRHLFFGQGTGTAPNLQVIPGRIPRVPTSIVAAEDNVAHEWQANPIAAFAEFLLADGGAGFPIERMHAASWLEAGHWAWLHRDYTFCSPLLTEQLPLRQLAKRWLEPIGAYLRWTDDGKLACHIYEWGTVSGSEPVLDYRHWVKEPEIPGGDWEDVPTELVVGFTDAAYEYQKNTVTRPNAIARKVRGTDHQEQLDRRDITRFVQAQRHGDEANRRLAATPTKATIPVRRPFADALQIGSKVLIDVDREPGGAGLAQLARVEKIKFDASDEAQLEIQTDNLAPAVAYTPGEATGTSDDPTSPPIVHKLAFPLPPAAFGWPLSVGIVATRPTRAIDGMHVFFAGVGTDPFAEIGTQYDFACRGQLAGDIAAGATSINVTELDGENGPEASLAANTPGNLTAAQNNTLLILLAQVDGNGRVALDGNGDPVMEFVSVIDRSGAGATRSYSVLRGRLDTPARAWTAGAVAWILPRGHITEWEPDYLRNFAGEVVHFRLVSFNGDVEDETVPVPECTCQMIGTSSPMYMRGLQGQNSKDVFIYQWGDAGAAPALPSAVVTYTFATGALVGLNNGWSDTPPAAPEDKTKVLWTAVAAAIAVGPTDTISPADWPAPRILTRQGLNGAAGMNAATVFIYKRAAAGAPPALPTTVATYTFATGALTGLDNGWSATPVATDGNPQWVAAVTASSFGPADTIGPAEWTAPVQQVKDGNAGASGLNAASIFVYKNAPDGAAPALPSEDVGYTFASGVATGLNNGWSQAMTEPAAGEVRWVSTAAAISSAAVDTIPPGEWAAARVLAKNGQAGAPGTNAATVFIYKRAAAGTPPALPSAVATFTFATGALTGLNNGWSATPVATDGNPQWVAAAAASSTGPDDTIAPGEWAAPVQQVKDGASGLSSASVVIYKNAPEATPPALPSADVVYTFATGVAAGLNNGWSQAMSTPAAGEVRWASSAAAIAAAATDTILSTEWAAPQVYTRDGTSGAANKVATPVISFDPPSYTSSDISTTCTIGCDTPGATIWYQKDGDAPRVYVNPFSLMRLIGIVAWAEKSDMVPSDSTYDMYEDNT